MYSLFIIILPIVYDMDLSKTFVSSNLHADALSSLGMYWSVRVEEQGNLLICNAKLSGNSEIYVSIEKSRIVFLCVLSWR